MLSVEPQYRFDHLNEITSIIPHVILDKYSTVFSFINSSFVSSQIYVLQINQSETDMDVHDKKLEELVPQTTKEPSNFHGSGEYVEMTELKTHKP